MAFLAYVCIAYILTGTGVQVGQEHGGVVPDEEVARLRTVVDDEKVDEYREPTEDKSHAYDNHRLGDVPLDAFGLKL